MDNRKIGVFDSGLGGLTVVRELASLMPEESIIYFGDTARLPYGSKSKERITEYSLQIMRFLSSQGVKAVVVACGTASTNALDTLKKTFSLPLLGVAEPGARAAVRASRNGKIGVIGTAATVASGAFEALLRAERADLVITSQACPLFVPLAEEGWFRHEVTKKVASEYLRPLKEAEVDTLILGCTHYPLLQEVIGEEMGQDVKLINVSLAAAKELKSYLEKNSLVHGEGPEDGEKRGSCEIYASDTTEAFQSFAGQVLGNAQAEVQKIILEDK